MNPAPALALFAALTGTHTGTMHTPPAAPEPTRIAVLNVGAPTTGGAVGGEVSAADFEAVLPELENAGVEVVVFRVNAGIVHRGGYRAGTAAGAEQFVTLISERYNPRFRTVAWIESALDTAAVAVWPAEELCFMPRGNYGAAVLETEPMIAAEGAELEAWLALGERASAAGGRSPALIGSMQSGTPLSLTVRADGTGVWTNDLLGEHIVNEQQRVLTLDARRATRLGISRGIAATKEELAAALGITSPVWVAADAAAAIDEATRLRAAALPQPSEAKTPAEPPRK